MNGAGPRIYNFDDFRLEVDERVLTRSGEVVHLPSKAFDILQTLLENNGRLVTKEALYDRVWADSIVEDANLTVQMSAIRKALGNRDYIKTVKGHGYRFTADVRTMPGGADGYLIESKTVSRVTIEHETEPPAIEPVEPNRQISGARKLGFAGHRLAIGAICVIVLLGAGFVVWREVASSGSNASEASGYTIGDVKRLTSTGRVATAAAISPDGKLFVYSEFEGELESLWLGHTDGGEPRQIRPPAPVKIAGVRFAPDGSDIYYVATDSANRSLFRIPVFGGAPERIRKEIHRNFSFSPDGHKIAHVFPGAVELRVSDLRTDVDTTIARAPTGVRFAEHSPVWSPDGTMIALGAATDESGTRHEVFVVDIASGSMRPLTSRNWASVDGMVWIGAGGELIVVANDQDSRLAQLWKVTYPSGDVEPLTSDLNIYSFMISASTSSDALLTTQIQQQSNIWIGPTDDLSKARQVTFGSLGRIDGWSGLDWTMDGTIVYTAVVDKISSIWTMAADGSAPRQLTATGLSSYHPSVSDDGRVIVFTSTQNGRHSIWRMNADGSDRKQLTNTEVAAQPHISPDGKWVVYVANRDDYGELFRIPVDGGEPLRLTDTKARWVRISPDGQYIAGGFKVNNQQKLGILPINGGEFVRLFDVPRTGNMRLGVRWTPDGKSVTYRDWAHGIWKQDLDGGQPTRIAGLPEEKLYAFDWEPNGARLAFSRGSEIRDVVLIRKGATSDR